MRLRYEQDFHLGSHFTSHGPESMATLAAILYHIFVRHRGRVGLHLNFRSM